MPARTQLRRVLVLALFASVAMDLLPLVFDLVARATPTEARAAWMAQGAAECGAGVGLSR